MTNEEVLKAYEETNALLKGHFKLSSGRHSDRYIQSALVLQYPWIAEKLCRALAEKVKALKPQAVLSPAMGGLFVGQELARALGVRSIFTERNKETDAMENLRLIDRTQQILHTNAQEALTLEVAFLRLKM